MKKVIKRIINKDLRSINENNLNEKGIYIEFNEENMLQATAMVIGPKDTIYENCILFFDIEFTSQYPFEPPIIKYHSTNNIRIHPNIYVNGKICLSILNTWTGPKWSSIYDISSIFITIQSLLDNNPLYHEPGYKNAQDKIIETYNRIIEYNTLNSLIVDKINNTPQKYNHFNDIIILHIKKEFNNINNKINNKVNIVERIKFLYNINININYYALKTKFEKKQKYI